MEIAKHLLGNRSPYDADQFSPWGVEKSPKVSYIQASALVLPAFLLLAMSKGVLQAVLSI